MYKRQILTKTNYPIVVSQPYKINNKDICTGVDKVSCIVMVHTAPGHFESPFWKESSNASNMAKLYILQSRECSSSFSLWISIWYVFALQIEKESEKFKDVVQGYFTDSYRNLTYNGVMGYEWISEHCRNAECVAKIDDDAFINFFKLFEEMQYLKDKKRYI